MGRFILARRISWPGSKYLGPWAMAVLVWLPPGAAWGTFQPDVPNSCIECHQTLAPRWARPVALWSTSVHAEVGNTCEGCHRGDPGDPTLNAMSQENRFYVAPKTEEVTSFCGKCHQELSEYFQASAHGAFGEPTCIDCHGSHSIRRASIDIIRPESCSECHDYASPEKLKTLLQSIQGQFAAVADQIGEITGFPTGPVKNDLKKIRGKIRQVRMLSHSLDISAVEEKAQAVRTALSGVDAEIQRLVGWSRSRGQWGVVVVVGFLVLAGLVHLINRAQKPGDA